MEDECYLVFQFDDEDYLVFGKLSGIFELNIFFVVFDVICLEIVGFDEILKVFQVCFQVLGFILVIFDMLIIYIFVVIYIYYGYSYIKLKGSILDFKDS